MLTKVWCEKILLGWVDEHESVDAVWWWLPVLTIDLNGQFHHINISDLHTFSVTNRLLHVPSNRLTAYLTSDLSGPQSVWLHHMSIKFICLRVLVIGSLFSNGLKESLNCWQNNIKTENGTRGLITLHPAGFVASTSCMFTLCFVPCRTENNIYTVHPVISHLSICPSLPLILSLSSFSLCPHPLCLLPLMFITLHLR